jgi:hypothetical protein
MIALFLAVRGRPAAPPLLSPGASPHSDAPNVDFPSGSETRKDHLENGIMVMGMPVGDDVFVAAVMAKKVHGTVSKINSSF